MLKLLLGDPNARKLKRLRGYGQKDPLIEYKNEGYDMFLEMMTNMRRNVFYSMFMFQPSPRVAISDTV